MDRTKIDAFIKQNIGTITLIGGLLGIIPLFALLANRGGSEIFQTIYGWVSIVKPFVSFEFSPFDYFNDFYLIYRFGYLWMPIIFYGTMLIGFFTLKNESSISYRLIRFAFSVIFISHAIETLWIFLSLMSGDIFYGFTLRLMIVIIFKIAWAYIAFTILRGDNKSVDNFGAISPGDHVQLNEVPQGSRFIHHLIDSFLYIGVCSGFVFYFGGFLMHDSGNEMGSSLMLLIVLIVARLIYMPIGNFA